MPPQERTSKRPGTASRGGSLSARRTEDRSTDKPANGGSLKDLRALDANDRSAKKASRSLSAGAQGGGKVKGAVRGTAASQQQTKIGTDCLKPDEDGNSRRQTKSPRERVKPDEDGNIRVTMAKRVVDLRLPRKVTRALVSDEKFFDTITLEPNLDLELDWAYGYDGQRPHNLFLVNHVEVVYSIGAVVVVFNFVVRSQRFFTGHTEKVSALHLHRELGLAASAQQAPASGSGRPQISVWSVQNQAELLRIQPSLGHQKTVDCLTFTCGGRFLLSCGLSSSSSRGGVAVVAICVWSLEQIDVVKGHTSLDSIGRLGNLNSNRGLMRLEKPLLQISLPLKEPCCGLCAHPDRDGTVVCHSSKGVCFAELCLSRDQTTKTEVTPKAWPAKFGRFGVFQGISATSFVMGNSDEKKHQVDALVGTSEGLVLILQEVSAGEWRATESLNVADGCPVAFIETTPHGFLCGYDGGVSFFGSQMQTLRESLQLRSMLSTQPGANGSRPVALVPTCGSYCEVGNGTSGVLLLATKDNSMLHLHNPYSPQATSQNPRVLVLIKSHRESEEACVLAAHPTVSTKVALGDASGQIIFLYARAHEVLEEFSYRCPAGVLSLAYAKPAGQVLAAGLQNGEVELISVTDWAQAVINLILNTFDQITGEPPRCVSKVFFADAVRELKPEVALEQLYAVWDLADAEGHGELDIEEFSAWIRAEDAFERLGQSLGLASVPELLGKEQVSQAPVTEVRFPPAKSQYVAVVSADMTITIFTGDFSLGCESRTWQLERLCVLKGNTSPIVGIHFSACAQYLMSNSQDAQILAWDIGSVKRLSTDDSAVCDLRWFVIAHDKNPNRFDFHQWNLSMGWPTIGLWQECSKSSPSLLVQSARQNELCAAGSENGDIRLYRFPLPVEGGRSKVYYGHGTRVSTLCWVGRDAYLLSADAGRSAALLQWRVVDPRRSQVRRATSGLTLGNLGQVPNANNITSARMQVPLHTCMDSPISALPPASLTRQRAIGLPNMDIEQQPLMIMSEDTTSVENDMDADAPAHSPQTTPSAQNCFGEDAAAAAGAASTNPKADMTRMPLLFRANREPSSQRPSSPPMSSEPQELEEESLLTRSSRTQTSGEDHVRVKLVTIPVREPPETNSHMAMADAAVREVEALRLRLHEMQQEIKHAWHENEQLSQRIKHVELASAYNRLGSTIKAEERPTPRNGQATPCEPYSARASSRVQVKMPSPSSSSSLQAGDVHSKRSISPAVVLRPVSVPNQSTKRHASPSCDLSPRSSSTPTPKSLAAIPPLRQASVPAHAANKLTPCVSYPLPAWSALSNKNQTVVSVEPPTNKPKAADLHGNVLGNVIPPERGLQGLHGQLSMPSLGVHMSSSTHSSPRTSPRRIVSGQGTVVEPNPHFLQSSHSESRHSGALSARSGRTSCGTTPAAPAPLMHAKAKITYSPVMSSSQRTLSPLQRALSPIPRTLSPVPGDMSVAGSRRALRWQSGEPVLFELLRSSVQMAHCLLLHEGLPPSNNVGNEHFTLPFGWAVCRSRKGTIASIRLFEDGALGAEVHKTCCLSNIEAPNGDVPSYTIRMLGLPANLQGALRLSLSLAPLGVSDATDPLRIPSADVGLFVPNATTDISKSDSQRRLGLWVGLRCHGVRNSLNPMHFDDVLQSWIQACQNTPKPPNTR